MAEITHWYLHVDLDAFFASVEQLDHPEYRGKPVIVGGKPEDRRSVVSTASYEARKFGVHSAMPTFQAYKLCPQGIFVHGRMQRYAELSYQIMNIFRDYSPDVDQMSIDEAFIDITGTEKLFGPPEETAAKIKEQVKHQTGLTVSIGLATNKYIAKIASGYNKPNGFTYIHKGDEQNFMLSLPLNKVWGLGTKSLELLRSKGINTTREIYERSFDTLEFLFGKNMATFLYNVVRGIDNNNFSKESKSHSISAERTFSYDLSDIYIIETELLELAQGVFFRLLKEGGYSRTAFIKIRFEDFSTFTVQQTLDHNIITIDSFFEIIKHLFEKRYENGRGIRLLGVGFENIEKVEKPYQQTLFSDGSEKKQAVEKAILKLEKKHPEIKIRKARTLKALFLISLLSLFSVKSYAVSQGGAASSLPQTLEEPSNLPDSTEESKALFNWSVNDTNDVEFELSGFWNSQFTTDFLFNFTDDGDFSFSAGVPVFKQEVDLSAWILLNKHWYFQTEFAEAFKKNTLTFGYKNGTVVKDAKFSNRNILFPSDYASEFLGYAAGGGENQAPGFSIHLESPSQKWNADFLVRYDMTESHSKTFFGLNSVTDTKFAISDFCYGKIYHFPPQSNEEFTQLQNVYVESAHGTYLDSNGKKYKKLSITDYTFVFNQNELLLSKNANAGKIDNKIPTVLITFNSDSIVSSIISKTGTYSSQETFAGQIQQEFNKSPVAFDLSKYSCTPTSTIEGKTALVIQSSTGFCPYTALNIYDCGLASESDLSVIVDTTDQVSYDYTAAKLSDSNLSLTEDFFNEKHLYAVVINQDNPQTEYPFASVSPEIYLNLESSSNLKLLSRNYSPVNQLEIGNNAAEGTVQVYKNGIKDNSAVYNKESGAVTLSSPVVQTDKIQIYWQEDSSDFSHGSITGAAGYKYFFNQFLHGDISLTSHWPLRFNNNFSTPEEIERGFFALSLGINYENTGFSITDKTAFALEKENADDKLLVSSQNNFDEDTYYLSSFSGFSTKAEPFLNLNDQTLFLSRENNYTINDYKGISDPDISGYAIPLSFDFVSGQSSTSPLWASVDVKLEAGNLLKSSNEFRLALRPQFSESQMYDVYLQLGVKADSDFFGEESLMIPTWKLESLNLSDNNWQTVSVHLSDLERSRLISNNDLRIILVSKNNSAVTSGTLLIGPYEPVVQTIYTSSSELIYTTTHVQMYDNDYASSVNWTIPSTTDTSELSDSFIHTIKYFSASDFSKYETVNLDFSINAFDSTQIETANVEPQLIISLSTDSNASSSLENLALKLELKDISQYISNTIEFHKLTVNLKENRVYIDDSELNATFYNLYINKTVVPTCQKIAINTKNNNLIYTHGTFYIGNLYFADSPLYVNAKNYLNTKYNFKNGSLELSSLQSLQDFSAPDFYIESTAKGNYTIAGLKLNADVTLNKANLSNAGHSLKTEKALFNFLNLEENYRIASSENSISKNDMLAVDFSKLNFPLSITFSTKADEIFNVRSQNSFGNIKFNYSKNNYAFDFETKYTVLQKVNLLNNPFNEKNFDTQNYFLGWADISSLEFSTGYDAASTRSNIFEVYVGGGLPFAEFKPSVKYTLKSEYLNSRNTDFIDTTSLLFQFPFTIVNNNLSLNISRTAGYTNSISTGGNYGTDLANLFEYQKERTWFYTSIPFYELFDTNLINNITGNYSSKYEVVYKRLLFNDLKDFFIPSAASFAVIRDIKPFETVQDLYQYKLTLTNTSVNNFGSNSILKLFNWFTQEEIISSLSGTLKVPTDIIENATYQITAYSQITFIIGDKKNLTVAADGSFETNYNWGSHLTIIYSRPSDTSLVISFLNWLLPQTQKTIFNITRKEITNLEITDTDNVLRQNYSYNHLIDMNFNKYYTITNGIGASFIHAANSVYNFGINITLGAKIVF